MWVSTQLVEKTLFRRIRPSIGEGARGGGSPPRVGSNALNALLGKAFSERSEDFCAAAGRKSNGIFTDNSSNGAVAAEGQERNPADFSLEI